MVAMSSVKKPYVLCHTCRQQMLVPGVQFREMVVRSKEEVVASSQEDVGFPKILRCGNAECVAPQRAIVMPRDREPELVAEVRSWLPVATFRLRWDDASGHPDDRYAVAE